MALQRAQKVSLHHNRRVRNGIAGGYNAIDTAELCLTAGGWIIFPLSPTSIPDAAALRCPTRMARTLTVFANFLTFLKPVSVSLDC